MFRNDLADWSCWPGTVALLAAGSFNGTSRTVDLNDRLVGVAAEACTPDRQQPWQETTTR